MNIQTKTILVISTVFLISMTVFTIIMKSVLMDRFLQLEQQDIHKKIEQARNVIDLKLGNLERLVVDWAIWDDAYHFVSSRDQEFINSNLVDSTFTWNNLDFVIFLNTDGDVIYANEYDVKTESQIPASKEIIQQFNSNQKILKIRSESDVLSGFTSIADRTFIVTVSPILDSKSEKKPAGTLIMGQEFNEDFVAKIRNTINLRVSSHTRESQFFENNPVLIKTLIDTQHLTKNQDTKSLTGYFLYNDIFDTPSVLFDVTVNRNIYQQGLTTYNYMTYITVIISLILAITMIIVMRKIVVNKLASLTNHLRKSKIDQAYNIGISNIGNDEFASLSHAINDILLKIKNTADELGLEKQLAERSNLAKSEFLSQLGHEFHTPLNAIIGFSEISIDSNLDISTKENISQIALAGRHLLNLVDDLLDLAKIESGKFDMADEYVNINDSINSSISMIKPLLDNNSISIIFDCDSCADQFIYADNKRLKQVLLNILTNAIKYNKAEGRITVSCYKSENRINISVQDTGIGIESSMLNKIFDPYERGSNSASSIQGNGIGLSLTKKLIEAMNGTITVTSEPGVGSTFSIELVAVNIMP